MPDEFLYSQSAALIVLALLALLLVAAEGGYRVGRRRRSDTDETTKSQIGTIQGAILGLLGLLLGFTFAMAVSRFDARKQLVVEEANAIGTASLRGSLLPQPHKEAVAGVFRDYVDTRLEASRAGLDVQTIRGLEERTTQLQAQLWSEAIAVGEKDPRAVTTGLFIQSLNEVIDVKETRNTALNNHVPESVLFLLFIVATLAVAAVGYGCGLGSSRAIVAQLALCVLITLVVLVIVDLDRPRRGLIKVSQKSMMDLKESLKQTETR